MHCHSCITQSSRYSDAVFYVFPFYNPQKAQTNVYVLGKNPYKYYIKWWKYICDWLWENPPVMHKDNYLEKHD